MKKWTNVSNHSTLQKWLEDVFCLLLPIIYWKCLQNVLKTNWSRLLFADIFTLDKDLRDIFNTYCSKQITAKKILSDTVRKRHVFKAPLRFIGKMNIHEKIRLDNMSSGRLEDLFRTYWPNMFPKKDSSSQSVFKTNWSKQISRKHSQTHHIST